MTANNPIITKEVAALPRRSDDAHKGSVGRIMIIGGCCGDTVMAGAPALAANAALRSGAGLVQLLVPESLHAPICVLAPCATLRTLPTDLDELLKATTAFGTDVVVVGPGLGQSLAPSVVAGLLARHPGPIVVDADGLNLLAAADRQDIPDAGRVVMTPHPGELHRLLTAVGTDRSFDSTTASRQEAAGALAEAYGCTAVLKGRATIITNDRRLYVNETGNSGMATGGTGDVLSGVIAALIGQEMDPFEAAILGVYLHGLAGDFAAEELGRWSMTATDLLDYLPEAFCEHDMSAS